MTMSYSGAGGPYNVTDTQTVTVSGLTPYLWTGSIDTDWGLEGNWDTGDGTPGNDGIPTAGDNVLIPFSGVTNFPILDTGRSVFNITIVEGASLELDSQKLSVFGSISNDGTMILDGVANEALGGGATFDINSGKIEYNGDSTTLVC